MNIFYKLLRKETLHDEAYSYESLLQLHESYYPEYIEKLYKLYMGKPLDLNNPKSFSEKIQWLKLYDFTPLKTYLTDKVLVRDWVREKIGDSYLKPVYQVCKCFDDINFDKLPDSFIIRANHGRKWSYKIKDKSNFLSVDGLFDVVKKKFDKWMSQNFFALRGLELQYKDIVPQIFIEPIMIDKDKLFTTDIEIYCFDGIPMLYEQFGFNASNDSSSCSYPVQGKRVSSVKYIKSDLISGDDIINTAVELSKILSEEFKFVRVDWMVYNNKLYFNEMNFTPFSGYNKYQLRADEKILGSFIKLK